MIAALIASRRRQRARRRLQRLVDANRRSFEVEQFRRRRQAMLKHSRKA